MPDSRRPNDEARIDQRVLCWDLELIIAEEKAAKRARKKKHHTPDQIEKMKKFLKLT